MVGCFKEYFIIVSFIIVYDVYQSQSIPVENNTYPQAYKDFEKTIYKDNCPVIPDGSLFHPRLDSQTTAMCYWVL